MLAEQLIWDYRQAHLSAADRALCDYAVKLTCHPAQASAEDLQSLRNLGWTDIELHLAVQIIGYFNYINRVADGLGVDPEAWMRLDIDEWKQRKARFQAEPAPHPNSPLRIPDDRGNH